MNYLFFLKNQHVFQETLNCNRYQSSDTAYSKSIAKIQDVDIKMTKDFQYLGVWISYDEFSIEDE